MTPRLRPLTVADVGPAAALHRRAFPAFFLSTLGEPFLAEFYRGFLSDATAVTVVALDDEGRLAGVVVGTLEPTGFFRRLMLRRWPSFAWASLRTVVTDPGVTPRLIRAVAFQGGIEAAPGTALLSSICVQPAAQGQGLGRRLIDAWTAAASDRGAPRACLTTDAEHNDSTLRFYESSGWTRQETFRTPEGRAMHCYRVDLEVHSR